MHGARCGRKGFTLIELLVVMAVIAVFLGVIGLAISGGDGTVAAQSGQRSLSSMISSARSHAVLNQANTRLIIHVDAPVVGDMGDPRREKYLRFMAILVQQPNDSWKEFNDGSYLPRGIYFVPPRQLDPPSLNPSSDVIPVADNQWSHDRRTFVGLNTMEHAMGHTGLGTPPPAQLHRYIYLEFSPRGLTDTSSPEVVGGTERREHRIVIAPASGPAGLPRFSPEGDSNVLGGMIRRNGSFTLVHNAEGFPPAESQVDP